MIKLRISFFTIKIFQFLWVSLDTCLGLKFDYLIIFLLIKKFLYILINLLLLIDG